MLRIVFVLLFTTLGQASDCVTETIDTTVTIPASNALPLEIYSAIPGTIIFKRHNNDTLRDIVRITGQVSHQMDKDIVFTAEQIDSLQAYAVQLNYEGTDFYSKGAASTLNRPAPLLTIGTITTGLCMAAHDDISSCALLGGLVSLPFASADCEGSATLTVEIHESANVRMRSNEQSEATIVRCPGIACASASDDDCNDGDATQCFSGDITYPYQVPSANGRFTALPPSQSGRLLHLVKNAGTDSERVVGRSYDAYDWESLVPEPATFTCNNRGCQVSQSNGESYIIRAIEYDSSSITDDEKISRFLSQSTFGATNSLLQKFNSKTIMEWMNTEMSRDWKSLRSYVRERMNPRDMYGAGALRLQCERGSRWNKYAFNKKDEDHRVNVTYSSGKYYFYFNDVLRTETDSFITEVQGSTLTFPVELTVCSVLEDVGQTVKFGNQNGDCSGSEPFNNPVVSFTTTNTDNTHVFTSSEATFQVLSYKNSVIFLDTLTNPSSCEEKGTPKDAFLYYNGEYYRHDARLKLVHNTIDEPADIDAVGTSQCPAVHKNFLNKDSCVRRQGCAPLEFTSVPVYLNETTLRFWYEKNTRYTYYIKDLRLEGPGEEESPCVINGGISRWLRNQSGPCAFPSTDIDQNTTTTLTNLLSASTDTNEYIRDINVNGQGTCIASDESVNAKLTVGNECFTHTHYQNYHVFDFTYWAETHDGNRQAMMNNNPNPIKRWAINGLTYLEFPIWHVMRNWYSRWNRWRMPEVGRFGDTVDFTALNTELQTYDFANEVGAIATRSDNTFEVCGSTSEVANDPFKGHLYHFVQPGAASVYEKQTDVNMRRKEAATSAWTTNAVTDENSQLRQRIAWALSQILVASTKSIGRDEHTELWTHYYDIFLKNSFGNYRDILKEVTYSPVMADYLTYRQNKAFAFQGAFPDENYAREIMQLFSIGLWKLNQDGTRMRDDVTNDFFPTYDNDDVVVYARVFTSFDRAPARSNTEVPGGITTPNMYDPLILKPEWKDNNPKTKLESGYLGDFYPICEERDPRHFLKKGARYEYTGSVSALTEYVDTYLHVTKKTQVFDNLNGRFAPDPSTSALYDVLCAAPSNGQACTFPLEVTLSQNLACDGKECDAQRVLDVQIFDAIANVTRYYVYRPEPCVRLSFFENGRVTKFNHKRDRFDMQCTKADTPGAGAVCCKQSNPSLAHNWGDQCKYVGDYMTASDADSRCSALSDAQTCNAAEFTAQTWWSKGCLNGQFFWTQETCTNKVQVWESGLVSLVDLNSTFTTSFGVDSQNYFRVWWDNKDYPQPGVNNCGDGCEVHTNTLGDTCLCDFTVSEDLVFTSRPSSANDVITKAFAGSSHPDTISSITTYQRVEISSDLAIWFSDGTDVYNEYTIFEVSSALARRSDVTKVYLSNKISNVAVGTTKSFRNPPTFMPNLGENVIVNFREVSPNQRIPQAQHEVEALLDHLYYHDNTAPFVVYRLIQRLVTSNPSPRYVSVCVEAFRTGTYNGVTYSGEYGDLGATVVAILMDREARSTILDVDHTFGRLREPFLKFVNFLRAMEYEQQPGREISTTSMDDEIGQQPFKSETVFSYFLPEYTPDGPVASAGLVSPEALVGTAPYMINYLNGMTSLINQGLTHCGNGFGDNSVNTGCGVAWPRPNQLGFLRFRPTSPNNAESAISEMSKLLTPGRLEASSREMLVREYQAELVSSGFESAVKLAQKIFVSLPEFHSVTKPREDVSTPRVQPTPIVSQNRTYKAIVVIFEAGGADSFSLLVPKDSCTTSYDMYEHYKEIRGLAAIEKSLLNTIEPESGSQVCDQFGLHGALPFVKDLFQQDEEALFFANIGGLVEPLTRDQFYDPSLNAERPPQPFAHNIAQRTMHNLEAQNANAKGVLGRTIDAMKSQSAPYKCDVYSIAGNEKMMEGMTSPVIVDRSRGITTFSEFDDMEEYFENMTKNNLDSVFASTYQSLLDRSLKESNELGELLSNVNLDTNSGFQTDSLSSQFRQVAKLIKMRQDLGTERAVFLTKTNGWDTHNSFDLDPLFTPINDALEAFKAEMVAQGVWDDVVVLTVSDFGRTLTSNGLGTDHAWGGNHFMAGGSVKGKRILGQYPENLGPDGELNVGRGRLIPTLAWESMWNGVVEWFGVEPNQMSTVLPNVGNFPDSMLFSASDLFRS